MGWSSSDLGPSVLSTLIGFEADRVLNRTTPIDTDAFVDLVRFAVASETDESLDEDSLARLRAYTEWVYGAGGGWPPATLATGTEESITAIDEGIGSFNQRWRDPRGEGTLFGHLRTLRETGTALSAAEEALAGASNSLNAAVESAAYTARRAEWNAAYEAYDQRFAAFSAALANIPERYIREGFVGSGIAETARLAVWASASEAYDAMLAAFGGFPVRYPHWRFGAEYDELMKGYSYGLQKIYEMVINTDPCYAYLLNANELIDQKLVIAHVYGHCDFFKCNAWFSRTNRRMLDQMANHAARIGGYVDRFGYENVELFIDACLSLDDLIECARFFE